MTRFLMPDLGEGLHEAELVAWHVSPGDHVVADQALASVETDKAVVEIPAPWPGVVRALFAQPGDMVAIGADLVEIDARADAAEDAGAIVGEIPKPAPASPPASPSTASPAAPSTAPPAAPAPRAPPPSGPGSGPRSGARAAPAARRLAAELGVDLDAVQGSGPDGAVTTDDVRAASDAAAARWRPLRGVRRAMARNMAQARDAVARATVFDEADISAWAEGQDVTLRLVRAVVAGCRASPALNAWFDDAAMARLVHDHVDLGVAVETDEGLFVPTLRAADARAPQDLRAELDRMRADLRDRRAPRDALRGQTITLSNFGMLGGRHAAAVVTPPQVAILGAGRIDALPRIVGGEMLARRILPLSLSFDHRAATGAEATRFLNAVIADLAQASRD